MDRVKCNSCGGTYVRNLPDGTTYTHVCPPEVIDQYAEGDHKTGEAIKPATFKATANPRNENLRPHPDKPREYVTISEGSGVTEIK